MTRYFNITGSCRSDLHYMLPAEERLPDLDRFIEQKLYFVVHAARQTGKTTAMRSFAQRLRKQGVAAVHASLEASQGLTETAEAEPTWIWAVVAAAQRDLAVEDRPPDPKPILATEPGTRFHRWLMEWCTQMAPRPVVLLLDEADVVSGQALVSLLRQLRSGFDSRPEFFPSSIALVGMRDLQDYLTAAKDGTPVNPGSPFNIKAASLTLRNFTQKDVASLYAQHTTETKQVFTPDAVERVFYWTQGQPFLVNAIARIAVTDLCPDPVVPIDAAIVNQAKEQLIRSRTTHLFSLAQRLREPRIARIVRPVILGDEPGAIRYDTDDFDYAVDMGLLRRGPSGAEVANPLYREVLVRQLSMNYEAIVGPPWWPWQTADGHLAFDALVDAFIGWWRENAEMLTHHEDEPYKEAAAHLAFMGFLQRIVNGGGSVAREYADGRGRVDVIASWGGERFAVELKRVPPMYRTRKEVEKQGIQQLSAYLDGLGLQEGWLLIFDQTPDRTWKQRCWRKEVKVEGRTLHLRGA